ncbi:MAG: helix-turn-helix domain-containing protein [Nanoarchaeota archaeon]|nr:helix-turn-helix domain-containing protein [Nanoarchaeota archaeon]
MESEKLIEAGLTKNESKVYLALLDLGPSLAGLISRKTGLHRRTVYDTTEMLIKKGLIGYILKNNRRLFQASPPINILNSLHQKQLMIEPLISTLNEKYSKTKEKEETNFYKGKEGLKAVFEDQLNENEILILGASLQAYEILKFYFHWYDKKRKSKKIKVKIITQDKNIKKVPLSQIRYLPEEYSSPIAVNIYGKKTAIILWAKEPIAIVIKHPEITLGYRKYFDLLWKIAKK